MMWNWVPNKSFGPILLGENVSIYAKELKLILDDSGISDSTGWNTWLSELFEIMINSDFEKVISVTAYDEFCYEDKNIIGMSIDQLLDTLGDEADEVGESVEYDDGDVQTPYEFYDLGLQDWLSQDKVVSISCLSYEDD